MSDNHLWMTGLAVYVGVCLADSFDLYGLNISD